MKNWFKKKSRKVLFAYFLLVSSVIGLPISLIFTREPPFILALSWLSLMLTAYDILQTAKVHTKLEN